MTIWIHIRVCCRRSCECYSEVPLALQCSFAVIASLTAGMKLPTTLTLTLRSGNMTIQKPESKH